MDIEVYEGSYVSAVEVAYDDDPDLSGATMSAAIRSDIYSSTDLVTKADGVFNKDDAATGTVTFPLTSTDTGTTLGAGTYVIQVEAAISETSVHLSKYITLWIKEGIV